MGGLLKWPTKAELTNLRAAKRALARSVAARIHGGGDVSAEIRKCWFQWERHTWNPSLFPDLWSDLHFQDGTSLQRESPPQLGAAVGIRPSGTLSPGVLTPFEVVAEDADCVEEVAHTSSVGRKRARHAPRRRVRRRRQDGRAPPARPSAPRASSA